MDSEDNPLNHPAHKEVHKLVTDLRDAERRLEALRRDFLDIAGALGCEASFQAVAQRVADLLTLERDAAKVRGE